MSLSRQALISVSDKTGVAELAVALEHAGFRILSTGGTAKLLAAAGIGVTEVAEHTGFPEMLDGRVKTLHPAIHGGILARRDLPAHMAAIANAGIGTIDVVVVNLYPFRETVARPGCSLEEAIENIDIGGPAMVRAAAKNHDHVAVVTDPADYAAVIAEIRANGEVGALTRFALATKAFRHTAQYDDAVAAYLAARTPGSRSELFPPRLNLGFDRVQTLRYGENAHQQAAFYRDPEPAPGSLATGKQLQGKALSYNNLADADAAWECVKTFEAPACVIVKHANPCGVAVADTPTAAYQAAFLTDPASAFGGIVAFNRALDRAAAEVVTGQFVEVVIAPGYSADAKTALAAKANVRVLQVDLGTTANALDFKRVGGGLLVQTPDTANLVSTDLRIVTRVQPTATQIDDLLFAWRVAKFVKSNAIVFCAAQRTVGVGAGQMSRIDSARIAAIKAGHAGLSLNGSVVASDAFFPFRDGLDAVADAGALAVIQPGGSMRDDEVIAAADERGIAMAFSGIRHFRH